MVRKPDDKTGIIISMRILLIEDDQQAASYLVKGLAESGYVIDHAADGEQGLNLALSETYDILVVDRMLPKRDGLSLIRMLRADGNDTPILVLSALGEVDDRVEGLRSGGDDYLIKPYAFAELLARLEALVRRRIETKTLTYLKVSDLELNQLNHKVSRARQLIRR
jgi:two-component system OmpR family response regulator